MFHGSYLVWALLPVGLWLLTIWAFVKPVFGVSGREDGRDYLRQAVFVLIGFIVALYFDQNAVDALLDATPAGDIESLRMVSHWLLYPVILVMMASISRMLKRWQGIDESARVKPGSTSYQR